MPIQLFPLALKGGGILKDGGDLTDSNKLFQNEFCTDGQWVRFYQGKPKKIGGQRALADVFDEDDTLPQDINCFTSIWAGDNLIHIAAGPDGIYTNTSSIAVPTTLLNVWQHVIPLDPIRNEDILWQINTVIRTNINEQGLARGPAQTSVVMFGSYNKNNINNTIPGLLYKANITGNTLGAFNTFFIYPIVVEDVIEKDLPNLNGGMCFVDNLLFLYGTKGTVTWSKRTDPFHFNGGSSGRVNVSNDKVIYGAGVRGGSNPPTLLFWTINSVVKVSNQSNSASATALPEFQVDIITRESSILSSRSIVEYDGMFFWLGVDRIFLYNGVVREVLNNTNFDWFFSKLDIRRRQLVFGIKNAEKGEIWWYFPVIGVLGGCTAALIYNIRENTWYNTDIKRDCGIFEGSSGKMFTYGKALVGTGLTQDRNYIWEHEVGVNQMLGEADTIGIPSSFTTPTISLTSFNPLGEGAGVDNLISIERIEPDFGLATGDTMLMTINSRYYASDALTKSDAIELTGGVGKVDLRFQGRNISFTFASSKNFQFGHTLIGMKVGDGR